MMFRALLENSAIQCLALLISMSVFMHLTLRFRRRKCIILPPGPNPLPVIGNLLDFPKAFTGKAYLHLSQAYGDIVYLRALGQSMLIVSSHKVLSELLEKRSANYSDRIIPEMAKLTDSSWLLVFGPYDDAWRRRRRDFHSYFAPQAIVKYHQAQEETAHRFARNLLTDPNSFNDHIHFAPGSLALRVAYGLDIFSPQDEYLALSESIKEIANKTYVPGQYLVEIIPILRLIPSWFPGAQFKRDAIMRKGILRVVRDKPFDAALKQLSSGGGKASLVSDMVEKWQSKSENIPEDEVRDREVAGTTYGGAVDTVESTLHSFLFAMASHPECQKRAQAELDAVVGQDRLPRMSDRDSLPYVNALIKECLRWLPVAQLGAPHRSMSDDDYDGYTIPGGTAIVVNTWALTRDPELYPEPDEFKPDRYLQDGRLNVDLIKQSEFIFGFGRRICPGRHFGEASLFIMCACVLHTLLIEPPYDTNGKPVLPARDELQFKPDFITHPEGIKYNFRARSEARRRLVLDDQ